MNVAIRVPFLMLASFLTSPTYCSTLIISVLLHSFAVLKCLCMGSELVRSASHRPNSSSMISELIGLPFPPSPACIVQKLISNATATTLRSFCDYVSFLGHGWSHVLTISLRWCPQSLLHGSSHSPKAVFHASALLGYALSFVIKPSLKTVYNGPTSFSVVAFLALRASADCLVVSQKEILGQSLTS